MEINKEDNNASTVLEVPGIDAVIEHKYKYFLQEGDQNRNNRDVNKDDRDKVSSTRYKFCEETDHEIGCEIKNYVQLEGISFSGLWIRPGDFSMFEEVDNTVDIIKVEEMCEVKEEEDESLMEMVDPQFLSCKNEEIEIKTDQDDFDSFQNGPVLARPDSKILESQEPPPHESSDNKLKNDLETQAIFQCKSCSYQTKYRKFLVRHMAIHKDPLDLMLFQCEYCPYQSRYQSTIAHHVLRHKDPSEVTMYQCDSCSFQTKYKRHLNTHSMRHKNSSEMPIHQCDTCSYQTKHKRLLARHKSIHHETNANVTIFHCASCSFQTKYKHHLKAHVLSHRR